MYYYEHNYIAAAITSNTPTTGNNKTIRTVNGCHGRYNFTYIFGEYYHEFNTEVTSMLCCENRGMTAFYNCKDSTN
jgi:hypothetical protein